MKTGEIVVVYVTAPTDVAPELARTLVERRLVACVNMIEKVRSIYRWEGAVQDDSESLLIMKTTVDAFSALEIAIITLHPYDVPEVIAVDITHAHGPYAAWVKDSVEVQ